ncbi:MAG: NACHT domain-containing protein [Nodosilinea sp. WJT8-NPBG4]|nr:NACHT domain-containing protein [Nodosilinea sp. WJT8-NPBG4]
MTNGGVVGHLGRCGAIGLSPDFRRRAKDVAKDAAKSYVGQCFKSVFSVIYKEPLTKATGRALKELLELIENELIRADIEGKRLKAWVHDVKQFINQSQVREAIAALFLQPDYYLDPILFSTAWQQLDHPLAMPEGFSWPYVAKRFAAKVVEIRQSSAELQDTFNALAQSQNSEALRELAGLPPDFNLETYREALVERYGNLDFASLEATGAYYSEVRLWTVFVPQSMRECHEYDPQLLEVPKDELLRLVESGELDAAQLAVSEKLHDERRRAYMNQTPKPVLDVTSDAAIQRLVILGDPGSGKSSLLRFLALQWARITDANQRYTEPLPLLIELRDYNRWECPSSKGFLKYLHEASTWHRLNQQTLKHLLEQPNRVVLLLDGLDEVFDPSEREQVVNDIHRFSNEYKQVCIVVTSRVVGYQPHRLRSAEFRHFMLQDLDKDQISYFLDRWHEVTFEKSQQQEAATKRERLDKAIQNSKSITQLAGNPLLLTMMAVLNRHQELPRDRVDLYQQCSRLLLHQWDVERTMGDFPGLSAEIGLREKTDILRVVAYAMQTRVSDESRANYIDGNTLTGLIEVYLRTELRFAQSRAVARALVEQLRARNFILCYLGANSYAFVHRTFLEYFCAAEIVHQFNVAKTLTEDGLIALFDAHCRDDDWREVLRLICGQIDETFVGQIVERLATRTNLEEWKEDKQPMELPLAIWCLSEVRNAAKLDLATDCLVWQVLNAFRQTASDFEETLKAIEDVERLYLLKSEWNEAITEIALSYDTSYVVARQFVRFIAIAFDAPKLITNLAQSTVPWNARGEALIALAKKWPDETTRQLLTQRAVDDENEYPRSAALQALAETWPDETTRHLLDEWVVEAPHTDVRSAALGALAQTWPDETTHHLLVQRAVQDNDASPRRVALQALAKTWPDETTQQLLAQRAVEDENESPRSAALGALAQTWPDESHDLLTQRVFQDPNERPRSSAWAALGKLHSEFGRVLPTRFLNGYYPYLDPLEPLPRDHIEATAKQVGIRTEDIDAQVAELLAYFGWDITVGARPSNDGSNE